MPYPYITVEDLRSRVSRTVLDRLTDDDYDGVADTEDGGPVETVIADASSKVAGYLRTMYPLSQLATSNSRELKRLTLDVARAYLVIRHPEHFPGVDGLDLMKAATSELREIRERKTSLDIDVAPEPAAQATGNVQQGNPGDVNADCPEPTWLWDVDKYY